MKKSVRVLAVAMALLMVMVVLASCGTKLSGTYKGTLTTLTFDGDKVTASDLTGIVKIEGTYKIDGDKITLTFDSDNDKVEAYDGTFDFEEGEDYIKIGTFGKFTKKADK